MVNHKHYRSSRETGFCFETTTCDFLKKQHLKILSRNYRCRFGEIDIIAKDQETLVFVEVRFRRNNTFGSAESTVNDAKQRRIIKTAMYFLMINKLAEKAPCRFDVVGIHLKQGKIPELTWIKNAFEA